MKDSKKLFIVSCGDGGVIGVFDSKKGAYECAAHYAGLSDKVDKDFDQYMIQSRDNLIIHIGGEGEGSAQIREIEKGWDHVAYKWRR